jgi:DNA-binding transcriptional ArsR family regulator
MKEDCMSLRDYERVMKSVADPTRVRILKLLEKGEMCVCQVIAVLEFNQSTISKHLFLLKMAELVKERKEGKWVYYSRNSSTGSTYARKMLQSLRGWLNDDPVISKDRKRETIARKMGPVEICALGMTLPRRAAACSPPGGSTSKEIS